MNLHSKRTEWTKYNKNTRLILISVPFRLSEMSERICTRSIVYYSIQLSLYFVSNKRRIQRFSTTLSDEKTDLYIAYQTKEHAKYEIIISQSGWNEIWNAAKTKTTANEYPFLNDVVMCVHACVIRNPLI